jgi:hypothetical protein
MALRAARSGPRVLSAEEKEKLRLEALKAREGYRHEQSFKELAPIGLRVSKAAQNDPSHHGKHRKPHRVADDPAHAARDIGCWFVSEKAFAATPAVGREPWP